MAKIKKNEDINNTSALLDKLDKYANSVKVVHSEASPAPYDGHGWHAYCHYYSVRPAVIPQEARREKYIAGSDDPEKPEDIEDYQFTTAKQFMDLKDYIGEIKKKIQKVKKVGELSSEKLELSKSMLVKLSHINALVDSAESLYRTMKAFDKEYDADDRCATTCQVYCQQACQNSCQNNCTCHDQHCGGF